MASPNDPIRYLGHLIRFVVYQPSVQISSCSDIATNMTWPKRYTARLKARNTATRCRTAGRVVQQTVQELI